MPTIKVSHIDAFSDKPNKGNPAGVVVNASNYSENEMQAIVAKVGFNETAFISESEVADFRLRYFTPGNEMDLCGHATVAAMHKLKLKDHLSKEELLIETKAGLLPISIKGKRIVMKQAIPQFKEFSGSKKELSNIIGLDVNELDQDYPVMYGSTGIWTLIVPIKELSSFQKMEPNTKLFPQVLSENPTASIHPICFEVFDNNSTMHGRHFSSPYSRMIEDSVTGTASGVMGAYYYNYVKENLQLPATLVVEQGHEMNKDGRVNVHLKECQKNLEVSISGEAVFVKELEITY